MLLSRGGNNPDASSRRELREIKDERNTLSTNSRVKAAQKAKERDLTPSRLLTSAKNIRLSNQVMVATG
jgi:hypothetical protein